MSLKVYEQIKNISDLTVSEERNLFHILSPFYLDPTDLLERELAKNDSIYLLKDEKEEIVAFFMVGWKKYQSLEKNMDLVYLGLSCVSIKFQDNGFASRLYYKFTCDAFNFEVQNKVKILLYGTTATPVVLKTLPKIWDNVYPELDGTYSNEAKYAVELVKKFSGLGEFSGEHPFVLKGVAKGTKYSMFEESRLKELELRNGIDTFKVLNIDEKLGDRLLIICSVPGKQKIDLLSKKLATY